MFDLHNERCEAKKGIYCLCVCVGPERGGGGERERETERERKRRKQRGGGYVCVWFGGGLGLTWQVYVIYVIQMLLNSFFKSSYYHKNIFWVLRKWFGVV